MRLVLPICVIACQLAGCDDKRVAPAPPAPIPAPVVSSAPPPTASAAPSAALPLPDTEGDPKIGWPEGYAPSRIREQVDVTLGSRHETWLLRWKKAPSSACFTEAGRKTARCLGLPGGSESGEVELVRREGERELEAIDLTEVIGEKGVAVLPRFEGPVRFSARGLTEAKTVRLMALRDVNLDGQTAEIVVPGRWQQTGIRQSILAGVSPTTNKVFAFISESASVWDRVAALPPGGKLEVITLPCLDHASPTEYVDVFTRGEAGVSRAKKQFACTVKGDRVIRMKVESSVEDALGL